MSPPSLTPLACASLVQQNDYDLRKEMKDKVVHYEGRLERMQHDFDEMQTAYSKMRNELDTVKQELKKSQASEERLKKELKQTKAELIHYKGSYEFMCRLLQSECHHEDVLRGMRKAMEKDRLAQMEAIGRIPVKCLGNSIKAMEGEFEAYELEVKALKASMGEELEWQRGETRKVKALVEGARKGMNDAIAKMAMMEREAKALIANLEAEMAQVKEAAAKECERMLLMLTAEQEDHTDTKRLLADERHARGLEGNEMEKMRSELVDARALCVVAEEAQAAAERSLEKTQAELVEMGASHAEHLSKAMEALTGRLEVEQDLLAELERLSQAFKDQDDARIAGWQSEIDSWKAKHAALQADRDELQARFDWLLMRWTAREPRAQDVKMMSALQEELSKQMHLTAHAVQECKEYKEALRTNDAAYTHLFGLGALMPQDTLRTAEDIEAQKAGVRPRTHVRPQSRPQSAAARPQRAPMQTPQHRSPPRQGGGSPPRTGSPPKVSMPASQPPILRPSSAGPVGAAGSAMRPTAGGGASSGLAALNADERSGSPRQIWASSSTTTPRSRPSSAAPKGGTSQQQPAPPRGPRPSSARPDFSTTRVIAHWPNVDPLYHNSQCMTDALAAAAETTSASKMAFERMTIGDEFAAANVPPGDTASPLTSPLSFRPRPASARPATAR